MPTKKEWELYGAIAGLHMTWRRAVVRKVAISAARAKLAQQAIHHALAMLNFRLANRQNNPLPTHQARPCGADDGQRVRTPVSWPGAVVADGGAVGRLVCVHGATINHASGVATRI